MKVSVVTASFNQGAFVRKCLDSVRAQRGDFSVEHIILDNCSTDNTHRELTAYRENPGSVDVRVLIERDAGQAAAINKGFRLASGDIVCWLNTDEWYADTSLETAVRYFRDHPAVDVLFGDCCFADRTRRPIKRKAEFGFRRNMLLFYGCFIPSCATFVRRRVLDEGCFLDPSLKVCMDFDWYLRLAYGGYRFAHVGEVLAYFTWHDENISIVQKQARQNERFAIQRRYCDPPGPERLQRSILRVALYYWMVRRNLWRIGRKTGGFIAARQL